MKSSFALIGAIGLILSGAPAALSQDTSETLSLDPGGEQRVLSEAATALDNAAILQGLDKITARISTFEAPIGSAVHFGSLEIVARACDKRPPEETPESAAFLEIVDVRPDSPAVPLFTGWMFASSPALSAVEHPVYDVWVVDCKKVSNSLADSESGN